MKKKTTLPFHGPVVGRDKAGNIMQAGPLTLGDVRRMHEQVKRDGVFMPKKLAKEWGLRESEVYHVMRMVPQ